jgi:hypothetical protein
VAVVSPGGIPTAQALANLERTARLVPSLAEVAAAFARLGAACSSAARSAQLLRDVDTLGRLARMAPERAALCRRVGLETAHSLHDVIHWPEAALRRALENPPG